VWLPCEFCQSRKVEEPCVKLLGEKTAARLSPSRPVPTAIDAVLPPEDGLLLSFVYSGEKTSSQFTGLCRVFATEYGAAISSESLRHAMLARAAIYLPPADFSQRHEHHKQSAWRALIKKTQNQEAINEADVFASCLLAAIAWRNQSNEERLIHHRGCLTLMNILAKQSAQRPVSDLLANFAPYIRDMLNLYDTLVSIMSLESLKFPLPQQRMTFKQRLRCFEMGRKSGLHNSAIEEAALDLLNDLFVISVACILRVAKQEMVNNFERDSVIEQVARHVMTQLSDVELRHVFRSMTQTAQYQQLKLASRILVASTVLECFGTEAVGRIAKPLIWCYRSEFHGGSQSGSYSNYCYSAGLSLAGLAIPVEEVPRLSQNDTTVANIGWWVVEELKNLNRPQAVSGIKSFWECRAKGAVVDVLSATLPFKISYSAVVTSVGKAKRAAGITQRGAHEPE
jgi:hypothetical protein